MSKKIVFGRASWTLGELLPIILTLGFGLLSLSTVFTEMWPVELARIGMIVGFGLTIYLVIVNWNRKRKSTIFAELENDDKYNVSVWMRKPLKHKWNGKLDHGENKGALLDTKRISMISVMSTRVIMFHLADNKQLYVPVRLLQENREARLYIVEAVEALGKKLKFTNNKDKEEFEHILLGKGKVYLNEKNNTIPQEKQPQTNKQPSTVSTDDQPDPSDPIVEFETGEELEPVSAEPEKTANINETVPQRMPTKAIGYEQYAPKSLNDTIAEAMDLMDKKKGENTQDSLITGINLAGTGTGIGINPNNSNSVPPQTSETPDENNRSL